MSKVLIIDDDKDLCRSMEIQLVISDHKVKSCYEAPAGLSMAQTWNPDLILLDLCLSEDSGLDVLRKLHESNNHAPIVMITGKQDMNATIEATRIGVVEYLRKPFTVDDVIQVINRIASTKKQKEDARLISISPVSNNPYEIIGADKKILAVLQQIGHLSKSRVTVLIEGESGTGKELVAKALHHSSSPDEPYVAINCSTIVPTLLESELFGHKKGAFTGADKDKSGKLQLAGEGTVFLDEIGDMPVELQAKLLRVLQERAFEPVGGLESIPLKARVLAATHHQLDNLVSEGRFREDLYYRLTVARISMPPLRERLCDVPLLVQHLISKISLELHRPVEAIEEQVVNRLQSYNWPGNVRELENVLIRAIALAEGTCLHDSDINLVLGTTQTVPEANNSSRILPLREMEKQHIENALKTTNWNITQTANLLEISPTTVRKKIEDYQLTQSS